jgi:hypothetical protein
LIKDKWGVLCEVWTICILFRWALSFKGLNKPGGRGVHIVFNVLYRGT